MSQTTKKGRIISEEKIDKIVSTLQSMEYSSSDLLEHIVLPLAQWLHDEEFSIEDTGYIISSIVNINKIQDQIDLIYSKNAAPIHLKSDLINFIGDSRYKSLEEVISPPKLKRTVLIPKDSDSDFKVDFINSRVSLIREISKQNGDIDSKETPIIEAVPHQLTVYDSDFIEGTRTFKIVWKSKHSNRLFRTEGEGTGATIKEIEKALINAGYTHNQRLMSDTLSAVINGMIDEKMAEVKDTIDNKGVYYHEGRCVAIKMDLSMPTDEEIYEAIDVLSDLHEAYSKEETTFATVIKWSLISIFSYAFKQTGNKRWIPWLYLVGAGGSGKTTMAEIGSYIYGEPSEKINIGGGSFSTEYRIGLTVCDDCGLRIVNEPAATFSNDDNIEVVKNCVELKIARKVQGKTYNAFSPVIFTANNFVPEMDSLYRRIFIIDFEYNQRKIGKNKKDFNDKFMIGSPNSPLFKLRAFGRLAVREIVSNPVLLFDDWKELADNLFNLAYEQVDMTMPDWLKKWSKDKDLTDLDNTRVEAIQSLLVNELYNARKRITLRGDYGQVEEFKLDGDEVSSNSKEFETLYWDLLNERVFSWALPHKPRGKPKSIFLNQGFKKLVNRHVEDAGSLQSIAQLLHWKFGQVRFGNSRKKGILVPFEDFMEFVYPSVDNDELE